MRTLLSLCVLSALMLSGCGNDDKVGEHRSSSNTTRAEQTAPDTRATTEREITRTEEAPQETVQQYDRGQKGIQSACAAEVSVCGQSWIAIKNPDGIVVNNKLIAFNSTCLLPEGSEIEMIVQRDENILVRVISVSAVNPKDFDDLDASKTDICPARANQPIMYLIDAASFAAVTDAYAQKEEAARESQKAAEEDRKLVMQLLDETGGSPTPKKK